MVLDIDYFRESPDPDAIGPEQVRQVSICCNMINALQLREAQKKRFKDPGIIDKVVEADAKWRQCMNFKSSNSLVLQFVQRPIQR